jgi:hypothetical protein
VRAHLARRHTRTRARADMLARVIDAYDDEMRAHRL